MPSYIELGTSQSMRDVIRFLNRNKKGATLSEIGDELERDVSVTTDHSYVTYVLSKLRRHLLKNSDKRLGLADHKYYIADKDSDRYQEDLPYKIKDLDSRQKSLGVTKRLLQQDLV